MGLLPRALQLNCCQDSPLCIGEKRRRVRVGGQIIRRTFACIKIKVQHASPLSASDTAEEVVRIWPAATCRGTGAGAAPPRALPSFLLAGETGTSSSRAPGRQAGAEVLAVDLDRDLQALLCSGRCLRDEGLWEGCMVSDFVSKPAIPFSSSGTAVEKHTRLQGNARRTAEP